MTSKPTIHIAGAVLSSLLFECANALTDFQGILLGTSIQTTNHTLSDNEEGQIAHTNVSLVIQGFRRLRHRIYNPQGDVDFDLFQSEIQPAEPYAVVGFFHFRRQTELSLSVREQLIMHNLASRLETVECIAIFTSSPSSDTDNRSTHAYDFGFWHAFENQHKLPVIVENMADITQHYQHFTSIGPAAPLRSRRHSPQRPPFPSIQPHHVTQHYDQLFQESFFSLQESTRVIEEKERQLAKLREEVAALRESTLRSA
ncbi:uncharacterized protein BYT42DRAFT_557792 [Radiomyces spectabilis]|uniref:uncharacterized protein n=1 Tax=Radiomyces spectabilis TaxID=64574 RepID=UPI0022200510|nr:uncharacterized protein BYT42DRAFT_557792 [Radiomyces spectabilis]KAI8391713.1 hypothetical protein BYT42DRAFT_557792 [Radiomyces spectabilis]